LSTRQLQAAEVLSKLSTMKDKSSFVNVLVVIPKQLVITKQLKLYLRVPARISGVKKLFNHVRENGLSTVSQNNN
jgi:hypothetical protein